MNPSAPDHGADQMDAKARPVHHRRDAEEKFCPVHRHHRREAAGASVDQVAAPVAVGRRNFRESFPAPGHDFHPSALADVAEYSVAFRVRRVKPQRVASAGQALDVQAVPVGRIVPVEKVENHFAPDYGQEPLGVGHPEVAQVAAVMARRIAALPDEEPKEMARLEPPMVQGSLALSSEPLQSEQARQASELQAREQPPELEPQVRRRAPQEQASESLPEMQVQRPPEVERVSTLPRLELAA